MIAGMQFASPAVPAQPDATTSYAQAFQVGRDLAQAGMTSPANPPSGYGVGRVTTEAADVSRLAAQIDATPPAQRTAVIAQAQQTNEQLAHVLIGLKSYPPGQRLAIAQHLAETTGLIDPRGVGASDITDQGIDAHLAQAMSVEQFLKRENLYASIPSAQSIAGPGGTLGAPLIEAGPDARVAPTGAGHLTNAQLSTALGL